jgi:hypothetical protein
MNGAQITNFFALDPYTAPVFQGIVMKDFPSLPNIDRKKAMYVLNTDSSSGKGEHWCLVFFDGVSEEFFDPVGMPPSFHGFERLLDQRKGVKKRIYNATILQNIFGITCGAHCLFFGFHRCRGYSMNAILKLYEPANVAKNDKMVTDFVTNYGESYGLKKF